MKMSLVLLTTLVACAGARPTTQDATPSAQTTPSPAPAEPTPDTSTRAALLWRVLEDERIETTLLSIQDTEVEVLARRAEQVVAWGDQAWAVVRTPVIGSACPCFFDEDQPRPPCVPEPRGNEVSLIALGSGEERVIAPADRAEIQGEAGYSASLTSQVGPLLFWEASVFTYGCGAHGDISHSAIYTDLRSAKTTPDVTAGVGACPPAAQTALVEGGELLDEDDPLKLTFLQPRWSAEGLVVTAQFTGHACYACTDGLWSSYSQSIRTDIDTPSALAPHADAPAWLPKALAALGHSPDASRTSKPLGVEDIHETTFGWAELTSLSPALEKAFRTEGVRSVCTVKAERAPFYDDAQSETATSSYLVKGDPVRVTRTDAPRWRARVFSSDKRIEGFLDTEALDCP